ncbi:CAP domain-containing protein [Psychrobacter sp. I-STPA6b]|uniref:CAP domain-containing protein n=1 Tax=Psychrobacter sp. I-STPA6b TaxID=2585718 RepID=UPI001D0C763D|nr:CAP domain-containing protein [Psychrobacter sp. I-STPA6b]
MKTSKSSLSILSLAVSALLLAGCGGGSGGGASSTPVKNPVNPKQEQPSTPKQEQPSTPKQEQPSTPKQEQPSTPKQEQPSTPKQEQPSTPKQEQPSTPKQEQPSTPKQEQPSTPKQEQPSTPKQEQPSTPKQEQPSDISKQANLSVYNQLNLRRQACGFGGLLPNQELEKAASNHANYLLYMGQHSDVYQGHSEYKVDSYSGIDNPYYTGNQLSERVQTGSNIGKKALAVNYNYRQVGEDISAFYIPHTYFESQNDINIALDSLNGLLAAPYHLASMVSPNFTEVGISYGRIKRPGVKDYGHNFTFQIYQSVLEVMLGRAMGTPSHKSNSSVLNYPCSEMSYTTEYELTNESPNPFGDKRDLEKEPIGQPIYILGNGSIRVSNYKMVDAANQPLSLLKLTSTNDPQKILKDNQVFLIPLKPLQPDQMYTVTYDVSVNGAKATHKVVTFKTMPKKLM